MHVSVTATAMPTVRSVTVRKSGLDTTSMKLSSDGSRDESRERVEGPEGVHEQDGQRAEIGDDEPADRAGEQRAQPDARLAVQRGARSAHRACGRGGAGPCPSTSRPAYAGTVDPGRRSPGRRRLALDLGPGLVHCAKSVQMGPLPIDALLGRRVPVPNVLPVRVVVAWKMSQWSGARFSGSHSPPH